MAKSNPPPPQPEKTPKKQDPVRPPEPTERVRSDRGPIPPRPQ